MAISYTIAQHGEAFTSKVKSSICGHIMNIELKEDCDNGWFVAPGNWKELDLYEQAAPTSVSAIVRDKAANGNWYCEIVSASNAFLVAQCPVIDEEFTKNFKKLSNFYNKAGDVVRAYELAPYDIIELSPLAFKGTVAKGDTVSLQAITGVTYAKQLGA
jgi:hypothetical protein